MKSLLGSLFQLVLAISFVFNFEGAHADDFEIHSPCPECFIYYGETPRIWDGDISIYMKYDTDESSYFPKMEQAIEYAVRNISIFANVPFLVEGRTDLELVGEFNSSRIGTVLIDIVDKIPEGEFLGYINLWWDWLGKNQINHAEIRLKSELIRDRSQNCINGLVQHELLHALGITHSESKDSIMFADPYNACEYQAILRTDDLDAVQNLYQSKPNRQSVIRDFNSEEVCIYMPEIAVLDQSFQVEACIPFSRFESVIPN